MCIDAKQFEISSGFALIAHMCSGVQKCDNGLHFHQNWLEDAVTLVDVLHFGAQARRINIGEPPQHSQFAQIWLKLRPLLHFYWAFLSYYEIDHFRPLPFRYFLIFK